VTPRVRPAATADAGALALVARATFLETFAGVLEGHDVVAHCEREHAAERYAGWLARPDAALWLAEVGPGAAPVGYALVAPPDLPISDPRASDRELKRIYVLSRFHGTGLGRALLAAVAEDVRAAGARRLLLGVYAGNARALAFYARHGFRPVAERQFRVGDRTYDDRVLASSSERAAVAGRTSVGRDEAAPRADASLAGPQPPIETAR
jgi:ribosomal protein S18 acetylase RimI-like enzyme